MDVIRDISPKDDMFQGNLEHYFHVGVSALECIKTGLSEAGKTSEYIKNILDLPCGYGRVLRTIKAAFPNARIIACDIDRDGVDFCADKFAAQPVYSNKSITDIPFSETFDLIWVGSLFTHLNLGEWIEFLKLFTRILNPGGLLVITFHGSYVIQKIIEKENNYGLNSRDLNSLLTQYTQNQFGYVDYPNRDDYGISVSTTANTLHVISRFPSLKVISYKEKAWDDHQDVLCCQKITGISNNIHAETTVRNKNDLESIDRERIVGENRNVIFCLPEGLTLGGVTTWSVELSRGLNNAGFPTYLGIHPSRYNNPSVDFGITTNDRIIDCMQLPHPDDPKLIASDYMPYYQPALPGVLIPNWSWGTYALAALFASKQSAQLRVIGMAHSDESGYYQWLVHYEAIIHKFIVANNEIQRKLSIFLPQRVEDILIKPAPVNVPTALKRTYSPPGTPLQIIYGGRIAQYQKRVFDLIELIKALADEGVDYKFRIIGGGADKEEFYKKINQLPEKTLAKVSLEDSVPFYQLSEIWRSSDINIMVSDFEGVSNSLLMGMAEGCVAVVTDVSGTAEVISSGVNGFRVPVGDMAQMAKVIKKISDDRNQLVELGKNAHATVEARYSQKKYISWFIDVLKKVWQEPARPWPPIMPPLMFEDIHHNFIQMNRPSVQKSDSIIDQGIKTILFLSHDANWGGAPKVLYTLIEGLDKTKWRPIVALPDHGELENEFTKIGVKTIISPTQQITADMPKYWHQYQVFGNTLRERTEKIAEIITQEQVDMVVTNTICIFEGALAAKLSGIPHIWYIHELSSHDSKLTPLFDFPTFYATIDSLSDKLVVISKTVKEEINQFYPSKKFELIYSGIKPIKSIKESNKKQTLGIETNVPVIVYVGIISERKGALSLIDIATIVKERYPQIKFVIAGRKEGETYSALVKLIDKNQLKDNFQFLGFRQDIPDVIACSDIVIIPSIIEPFSLVALEAMEVGKPVIATKSGGPEEIITHEETGILVPVNRPQEMAQAIIRLLENPELRKTLGQKGLQHFIEFYSYDAYINQFEKLFDEIVIRPKQKEQENKKCVENFYNLVMVAVQAKTELASLGQIEDPLEIINKLLNYSGNNPFSVHKNDSSDSRPKVSICVPVYNGSRFIRECIKSILDQTFVEFELILVDDASTDNSKIIIQSFSDPRIKYYENEQNLGMVGNWNRCLELSSGEYVCIFHQDDVMYSTNLEQKVSALNSDKNIGLIYSDTDIIDQKGHKKSDHWFNLISPNTDFIRPRILFTDLMFQNLNLICCPSVLARRECYEQLGGFDCRLPFSCDMEMWMRISLFYDIAYLSQSLIQYRFHESNLTKNFLDLDLIHVYLCKKVLIEKYPAILTESYSKKLVQDISQRVFERSIYHYHEGQYKTAMRYLYFLKIIRNSQEKQEIIDSQIRQLESYVKQANAINWISRQNKNAIPESLWLRKKIPNNLNRSAKLAGFINLVKPFIPQLIKNRLRGLKRFF